MSRAKKDKAARDKAASAPPQYCNSHVCWWHKQQCYETGKWPDSFVYDVVKAQNEMPDDIFDKYPIR